MTLPEDAARAEAVRDRYREVFGTVPPEVEDRLAVAEATGRLDAVEAIETLRRAVLADNPLEPRVQQLVHFAPLVALGREDPARLHARGARRAGATIEDLVGVAETSLVTAGMPAYALAIEIVASLDVDTAPPDPAGGRDRPSSAGELWDRRFAEEGWPADPDPFLVELAGALPPGRGLDLGSGPGRNSLWLAARGWDMTLVDASKVGLEQAAAAADANKVTITTVQADLADWQPAEEGFDLAIVANLHPGPDTLARILSHAGRAIRPGGHLYVVGHHLSDLGRHGPPDPDRLLTDERLRAALPPGLEVELLQTRERRGDHDHHAHDHRGGAHAHDQSGGVLRPDKVVVAWAAKPSPPHEPRR